MLRTFSVLEHIDDHAETPHSGQPYLLSLQSYADGHNDYDEHDHYHPRGDPRVSNESVITKNTWVASEAHKEERCRYKIYLPSGRAIKIGSSHIMLEKHQIDIQIWGGLDIIHPVHCKIV